MLLHSERKPINETRRQPTEWEKEFANNTSDKGLISQMLKALIQLNDDDNNESQLKMLNRRPEQTFSPRRYLDGQETHEKMLNVTSYQGHAKHSLSEMPPCTCERGRIPVRLAVTYETRSHQRQRGCRQEAPRALPLGMDTDVAVVENSMAGPQKTKSRGTM